MGFIKTVLIIVVAFYVIGFIGRYLVPFFIKRQIKKFHKQQNNYQEQDKQQKEEGNVTVNSQTKHDRIIDTSDAEFVDFEEVD